MPTEIDYEYDHSLYGVEHESGPFQVTKEIIDVYARSIGEDNPIYVDPSAAQAAGYGNQVAPPTLCALFERGELPDIKLQFGRRQFHGGQRVEPRAPIVAGDTLSASSHLKDVYTKTGRTGTMVHVVWETTFRNQDGIVVADVQRSQVVRE
jgi:acyl dehydratase